MFLDVDISQVDEQFHLKVYDSGNPVRSTDGKNFLPAASGVFKDFNGALTALKTFTTYLCVISHREVEYCCHCKVKPDPVVEEILNGWDSLETERWPGLGSRFWDLGLRSMLTLAPQQGTPGLVRRSDWDLEPNQ